MEVHSTWPHELNHGEDVPPPSTIWAQSQGGPFVEMSYHSVWAFVLQPGKFNHGLCGMLVINTDNATNYRYSTNVFAITTWSQTVARYCPATTHTTTWSIVHMGLCLTTINQDSRDREDHLPGNHIDGYDPFVLLPHELNHREGTWPTSTWTQSQGCLVVEKSHQSA